MIGKITVHMAKEKYSIHCAKYGHSYKKPSAEEDSCF